MTKSEHILSLNDGERTTRQIADAVYVGRATREQMAYTRIVLRQRKGTRGSKADLRYRASPLGREMRRKNFARRYYGDPQYRAQMLAYANRYYKRQRRCKKQLGATETEHA